MIQMIKGTDITLFTSDGTETVSNVLIGEPSETELMGYKIPVYTIAVPKTDVHDWLDRKVYFFGKNFRTVGHPQQGMDENIPLSWNKKIKVELLKTNGSCTVYEKDTFIRHSFPDALICDNRGTLTSKTGDQIADELQIYLYAVNCTDRYVPKIGDIIVGADCAFTFDTTTQQKASESMITFRNSYNNYAVIKSIQQKYCGNLPDFEITAR
ncbi:MAG: hypothetical protein J6Y71_07585 [Ruminococcus sp.]|nr:hypothetical protein [Ruminococcus sp.]